VSGLDPARQSGAYREPESGRTGEPLRDTCDDGSPCEAVCVMLCMESLVKEAEAKRATGGDGPEKTDRVAGAPLCGLNADPPCPACPHYATPQKDDQEARRG
jgi:hypothetical protein